MFAMILTRNARYDRVEVTGETSKSFAIQYPKQGRKGWETKQEDIPKADIHYMVAYSN